MARLGRDDSALGAYPPVLTPGGNFLDNVDRLLDAGIVSVDFAKAMIDSAIVADVIGYLRTVVSFTD